jgi:hypothetical protein
MVRHKRHWWAALDHEFAPDGICDDETYDRLPPLPEQLFTGDLGWLTAEEAGLGTGYMEPDPAATRTLDVVHRQLVRSGLALPNSFVTFMSSQHLQRRVPSSTGNGWQLSPLIPSPAEKYGFLMRFMHDQQGCWYYYLYLAQDGSCPVLGSIELLTPEDDGDTPHWTVDEFLESVVWTAPSFEHFLYRYWVENVILVHTIAEKRPVDSLPAAAREYVKLLQTPDRPHLDVHPAPLTPWADHPNQLTLW